METKTLHLPLLKASTAPGGVGIIVGYASVFGLKDEQNDIVPRGAFAAALAGQKSMPSMLWMHDITRPCGTWIKMAEDSIGLLVRGRLSLATKLGRDAYDLVKQGAVTGLSIGYRIKRSSYDAVRKARVLHEIILDEVSLVTLPANPAARISGVKHVKALGMKYSDNQPRVPAGNSDGGQWSDTGAGSGSDAAKPVASKPYKQKPIARSDSRGKPNHHMSAGGKAIAFVAKYEDFIESRYKDEAEKWTIGYGHMIKPGESFPDKITHAEAIRILKEDMREAEGAVKRLVSTPLTPNEFDAVTSYVFNFGAGNFSRSQMLKRLNAGDRDGAMKELLDTNKVTVNISGKVVKKEVLGLTRRRQDERDMFLGKQNR